jgi:hypothetical protein
VVLDRLLDDRTPASGVLCGRHAAAMVLPKGWWLDDRRIDRPTLFNANRGVTSEPVPPEERPKTRPRRPRRLKKVEDALPLPEQVEPVSEIDAPLASEPAVPMVVDNADVGDEPGWTPDFNVRDDLDGLLNAESPLLSRAFGGRARRGKRGSS